MSYHLSVPVLRHGSLKPSYSCISAIRKYFSSLPAPIKDHELIVVGDRIFTDIVLANRMSSRRTLPPPVETSEMNAPSRMKMEMNSARGRPTRVGPLSVWTSGVWEKESMPMRYLEKKFIQNMQRYVVTDNGLGHADVGRFLKTASAPVDIPPPQDKGILRKMLKMVSWTR